MAHAVLHLGHLNIWREAGDKKAFEDIRAMLATGIIALNINEGRKYVDVVKKFCKQNPQWEWYTAVKAKPRPTANELNNIILIRKDQWETVGVSTKQMCDKTSGTPDRHMLSLRVRHLQSNQIVILRCTHMNSHIEKKSWHRLPRWPEYQEHKRRLVRSMRTAPGIDILSMDVNASYRNPFVRKSKLYPYAALRNIGVISNYEGVGLPNKGTHGRRPIDAFFAPEENAEFVGQNIIDNLNSDHNGLTVKIRIAVR